MRSRRTRAGRVAARAALVAVPLVALACSHEEARLAANGSTEQPFAMGQTVQIGDYRLVVHDLTDPYVGNSTETSASSDDRWVAVDVSLTNTGDDAVEVDGWDLFEIEDATHANFQVVDPEDDTPSIDGRIRPGATRRGTLVFEVPREAQGFSLFFAGDPFASGSATVALS